jgi:hypothetical protein
MRSGAEYDRREYPRKLLEIEVSLSLSSGLIDRHSVAVHDISLSGMAIHPGALELHGGDKLFLCLSEKVEQCTRDHVIEATVVRLYQGLAGIRFDSVGIHVLTDIQRLLRDERIF